MNPLSAYLDKVETHTWRDMMKIYAAVMMIVGLLCNIFIREGRFAEDKEGEKTQDKYEDLDSDSTETTTTKYFGCSASLITDINLWIIAILLLSFAIYIPKIHFVSSLR